MRTEPNQPETITHRGIKFTLTDKWWKEDAEGAAPISYGPFYSREGIDRNEWLFIPDAAFLWTDAPVSTMHVVQLMNRPTTKNPGSVL